MLTHEKAIISMQTKPMNSGSLSKHTPQPLMEDSEEYSVASGASGSSSQPAKRARRTDSPLVSSQLFDEDQVVEALKGDIDMSMQERAFQLEKDKRDFELRVKERELEMESKRDVLNMQKSMLEITSLLIEKLKK